MNSHKQLNWSQRTRSNRSKCRLEIFYFALGELETVVKQWRQLVNLEDDKINKEEESSNQNKRIQYIKMSKNDKLQMEHLETSGNKEINQKLVDISYTELTAKTDDLFVARIKLRTLVPTEVTYKITAKTDDESRDRSVTGKYLTKQIVSNDLSFASTETKN